MALYIQIQNGQPLNHPATDENLIDAFGSIPSDWAPFNRIELPSGSLTPFQTSVNTYTLSSDGVTWQDNWTIVEKSDQEKAEIIALIQANPPFPNAILDTSNLNWSRPPKPTDGQNYLFNHLVGEWQVVPLKPTDGQKYLWNWTQMAWIIQA